MPRSIHPGRCALTALAALILAALACDTSSLPVAQPSQTPPGPTPTRRVNLGTSLPGSTAIPSDAPTPLDLPTSTAAPTFTSPPGDIAQVTRIVDGDTFKATQNGAEVTVRYIGINTPEVGQPCADEATAANQGLIGGQPVTLVRDVSDTDQYGRLLRYVYANGIFVNAELVRQGWAEAAKYPPDVAHADEFHALAAAARAANLGCWPTGLFGPPATGTAALPTATAGTPGSPTPASGTATAGTPAATPSGAPVCDCSYNKYNCSSFHSRAEAQACFDYCVAQGAGDVHMLDGNHNGIACENLP